MEHDGIPIGQLVKLLGTTTKTLRFYEDIGLLKSAQRSGSGYRLYDRTGVDQAHRLAAS